jgi:hypothetical protein
MYSRRSSTEMRLEHPEALEILLDSLLPSRLFTGHCCRCLTNKYDWETSIQQ